MNINQFRFLSDSNIFKSFKNGAELRAPSNAGASERMILGYVCSCIEALTKYVTLGNNRRPSIYE